MVNCTYLIKLVKYIVIQPTILVKSISIQPSLLVKFIVIQPIILVKLIVIQPTRPGKLWTCQCHGVTKTLDITTLKRFNQNVRPQRSNESHTYELQSM